jgi:hypothetical protein
MAYYTGTINSATPAVAYMDAIHPQMISGGLTFVETYTSGTDVTNIYKSPAGSNSLGIDYFIFINRPSTTGKVGWSISELYDVGTHLSSKFGPRGQVTSANADYSVVGTCLPSATTSGASLSKTGGFNFLAASVAQTYYLNVNFERCIFGFSNPSGVLTSSCPGMMYVGIYEPMYDSVATLPTLCVLTLIPSNNNVETGNTIAGITNYNGAMTRDYGVATTVSATAIGPDKAWGAYASIFNSNTINVSRSAGQLNYPASSSSTPYSNSSFETKRIPISGFRSLGASTQVSNTYAMGLLKDVILNGSGSGLSGIGGDTLSVTNFAGATLNYVKCGSFYAQEGLYWFPVQ